MPIDLLFFYLLLVNEVVSLLCRAHKTLKKDHDHDRPLSMFSANLTKQSNVQISDSTAMKPSDSFLGIDIILLFSGCKVYLTNWFLLITNGVMTLSVMYTVYPLCYRHFFHVTRKTFLYDVTLLSYSTLCAFQHIWILSRRTRMKNFFESLLSLMTSKCRHKVRTLSIYCLLLFLVVVVYKLLCVYITFGFESL